MAKQPSSKKPPNELLLAWVSTLKGAFPLLFQEESAPVYAKAMAAMSAIHGPEKVTAALELAIKNEPKYPPTIHAIEKCIAPSGTYKPTRCFRCEKRDGFIEVLCDGEKYPRLYKCKHVDLGQTVRVATGFIEEPKPKTAVVCDYVDAQNDEWRNS